MSFELQPKVLIQVRSGKRSPRYVMEKYLHSGIAFSLSQKQSNVLMEIFRNTNVMLCIQIVGFNLIANSAQIPAFLRNFLAYSPNPLLSTLDLSHLLGKKKFICPFVAGFCIAVLQLALHRYEESWLNPCLIDRNDAYHLCGVRVGGSKRFYCFHVITERVNFVSLQVECLRHTPTRRVVFPLCCCVDSPLLADLLPLSRFHLPLEFVCVIGRTCVRLESTKMVPKIRCQFI